MPSAINKFAFPLSLLVLAIILSLIQVQGFWTAIAILLGEAISTKASSENTDDLSYGRGMALIGSLAKNVSFSNGGATIEVSYDLSVV